MRIAHNPLDLIMERVKDGRRIAQVFFYPSAREVVC